MSKSSLSSLAARCAARLLPKRLFAKAHFDAWQAAGIHVTPNHFYEPIPDTRTLDPGLWDWKKPMAGIDFRGEEQAALLESLSSAYRGEYEALLGPGSAQAAELKGREGLFGPVDAEILYGLVRRLKPKRILEIGSGFSTRISAHALRRNLADGGAAGELVAIEPFPDESLRKGFPGLTRLVEKRIQEVPVAWFESLEPGDIVFIDSTHVFKLGSDVQFEFYEILPRIPAGVHVHFHDIFLPSEYPRSWAMDKHIFWNEQYFLHSFLLFNSAFRIVWGSSYMHLTRPEKLAAAIRTYDPAANWPGSFWIKRES